MCTRVCVGGMEAIMVCALMCVWEGRRPLWCVHYCVGAEREGGHYVAHTLLHKTPNEDIKSCLKI